MIINRQNLSIVSAGYKAVFHQAFGAVKPNWNRIAMEVPSDSAEETYAWLGKFPIFREWLGDRQYQNLAASGYTIKNKSFENTVDVDRDDLEDDKVGIYRPAFQMLGQQAAAFPDDLSFPLAKAGNSTLCYDGQYFFDTDHPVQLADGSWTTKSNWQGGSGAMWMLLVTTMPVKPFIFQNRRKAEFVIMDDLKDEAVFTRKKIRYGADLRCNVGVGLWQMGVASKQTLDPTNYAAARATLASMVADGGKKLNWQGDLLATGTSLEGAARQLLNAEQISGTTNVWRNTADLLVTSYLD